MTMPSTMQVQPYLFFEGRCQEALEFYRRAIGAEVPALMRFKESPDPGTAPPGAQGKVTQADTCSVGVTAHHMAGVLEAIAGMIETVASGRPYESFNPSLIDEMNARHARDYASCTKAETIELFRQDVGVAAATIRRLSDEQLVKSAKVMSTMPPMTVEQLIAAGLLAHIDDHFGSIRKTAGH